MLKILGAVALLVALIFTPFKLILGILILLWVVAPLPDLFKALR